MTAHARWSCLVLLLAACHHDGLLAGAPRGAHDGGAPLDLADPGHPGSTMHCRSATSQADCEARPGCQALTCPTCTGTTYIECVGPGEPGGVLCAAPTGCGAPACNQLISADACDQRSDCYSVFSGTQPCDLSWCQNSFRACLDGGALCVAGTPVGCLPLDADCVPGDLVAYDSDNCPIGCVHQRVCGL